MMLGVITLGLFVVPILLYYSKDLPDYKQLEEYDPPTISRIYAKDGALMAELAKERRIFREFNEIPELVIDAFLAAEDQNYYEHQGIDIMSILRAAFQNASNIGTNKNPVGGSTITQQVVKNFLLTNERSFSRKIKEAILAYRISKVYSKDRILELYLNQIYLGNGSYGVASAAINYFNKDLKDVTLEEAALLAAMPKAPSNLDPTRHPDRAKARRDWVLTRMLEENFITYAQAESAREMPIKLTSKYDQSILDNGYYTETVRIQLLDMYGEDRVYQDGYSIHTNLNRKIQKIADNALRQGLINYDRKHGYRGPVKNERFKGAEWKKIIDSFKPESAADVSNWVGAIVIGVSPEKAVIGLKGGKKSYISLQNLKWARKRLNKQYVGKQVNSSKDVLSDGDIIYVKDLGVDKGYSLEQIPDVNGGLVVMQPYTGRVLALVGGYDFRESKYNRATQAKRQPGSTFKPFVYLTALEKGFLASDILKDEALTIPQGPGLPDWTPKNFEGKFMGDITLRKALEKSRNLATVYLLTLLGIDSVGEIATRFGIYENPPKIYAMALGANESTLLQMTAAYTVFASGGMQVIPKLIDRIHDRKGRIIYSTDLRQCRGCVAEDDKEVLATHSIPNLKYRTFYTVDPLTNYKMVSLLQGVVERGTGRKALAVGKTLAGKTGTSNDSMDAWFVGFSPDLVCGIYVGYDNPKSLGQHESGATAALPIFVDFMKEALAEMPNKEFDVPPGIEFVKIDHSSGEIPGVFSRGAEIVNEPMKKEEIDGFFSFFSQGANGNEGQNGLEQNLDGEVHEEASKPADDLRTADHTAPAVEGVY
jgi:penicillin-binding protein 1A